ncbi:MAG TPA: molybdenum cofactor guanylyltransferase MobA [Acetobacteraceae bacterium]|nr:molybdenum cofactor guanylyltransferase MobA [Acetobacteraceae bacterium]
MMPRERIAALILAGGTARRMGGGDKPLLDIGGRTMLQRVIAALGSEAAALAISANGDPARFAGFGLPVLPDGCFAGEGPLAGLLAGLDWAADQGVFALLSVPGDTPFVPAGLAASLDPPPACVVSGGRAHHLVALWPVACRDRLRTLLSAPGPRSVARFAGEIGARRVDFAAGTWDPFFNINTPDDLAQARALAAKAAAGEQS